MLFLIIYINIKINLIFSSIYIIKFSSIVKRFSRIINSIINSIISNIINSTIIKSNIFTNLNISKKTKTKHTNKYR